MPDRSIHRNRLTAAADAAAGAGHNLNKLIIRGTCFNAFQHHLGRFKRMYYGNLHGYTCYINNSLTCLLHAAYLIIFKLRQLLAGNNLSNGTQSRFHYAACSAEDNCGTSAGSQRRIELCFFQSVKIYTCLANHASQLARCNNYVYITITAGAHFFARSLCLFRGTGHYRYTDNFSRVNACAFRKVGFGNSAEHLLRRFGSRKMRQQLRIFQLNHIYPAGAAGGNHRQHAAILQTLQELMAFLHNSQVGGKVCIKNLIKA